jgi:hypothetical protein
VTDLGDQFISAATLASATALTVPVGATSAIIQAEGGAVRWRNNSQTPTSSVGNKLDDGAEIFYTGEMAKFRVIRIDAAATLNVQYYG